MKAQASIEFLQTFIFFLMVVTVYAALFTGYFADVTVSIERAQLRNFASDLAFEINKVYISGDGASSLLFMPDAFHGLNYSIAMNSTAKFFEAYTDDHWHYVHVLPSVTVVQWKRGDYVTIENVNGVVFIK